MKHVLVVPFAKIILVDISKKQLDFFKNIYFEQDFDMSEKIVITISFRDHLATHSSILIAGKSARFDSDFVISDSRNKLCSISISSMNASCCQLYIEHGFDLYFAFTFIIEPLLIILSAANNIAYLHASAVADFDGKALVFSAWRHTGKTHRLLRLLSKGYSFIGDDYTVFFDGKIYSYPKQINLFSYNFSQFPSLATTFSFATRIRLIMFLQIQKLLLSMSKILSGSLSKTFLRLSELAEVATKVTLSPKNIGATVVSAKLKKLSILITGSLEQISDEVSSTTASNKLFSIISYELQDFFSLYLGFQYLFDEKIPIIESFEKNYKNALLTLPSKVIIVPTKTQEKK